MFSKKKKKVVSIRYEVLGLFLQRNFAKIMSFSLPCFYFLLLYFLTNACAQQQRLEGGPRDQKAPKLIEEFSTPNFQTNFTKQDIVLTFDEYIEVQNVIKQVIVSPPLENIPVIERIKGFKAVKFEFPKEEVLKEGVTYAINFGESIKDLTEGNKVENLQFLFSTGDYIDSLKMSGSIADALTGEPVEDVLFMLYESFADSVVRTQKPYYFGKTDGEGKFTINFLKKGVFKGFALKDEDLNYLFNNPNEQIGFTLDSIIIADSDSISTEVQIRLFKENTTLGKPKLDNSTFGLTKMGFKRTPYDAEISYDTMGQEIYQLTEGDTIKYWYNLKDSVDWNFYSKRDTIIDTLKVRPKNRTLLPIRLTKERKAADKIPLNPFKNIPLAFNHPIKNIDTSLINFRKTIIVENQESDDTEDIVLDSLTNLNPIDSLDENNSEVSIEENDTTLIPLNSSMPRLAGSFLIDSTDKRILIVEYKWQEESQYQLEILPNAITDWFDQPNSDTILLNYVVKPKDDFGTINLIATEMDSTQTYWFQLLFQKNVVDEFLVSNTKEYKRSFSALLPGQYSLKVIEDLNGNGRWDPGNYDKKLQPEKISTAEIEELRAGWDVEAKVEVKF